MKQVTERTPRYDFRTDRVSVCASGVIYDWTRRDAESLFESLRVGLYEASLYKRRDTKKKDTSEVMENS